ncbi:MAG: DNA methyltransferase, partial [Pseudomonadota bacterium]
KTKVATKKRLKAASDALHGFLDRLRNFRVLDPACGSGNFLYLSLLALKDIEHRANIEAEALGLQRQTPLVGPEAVLGIEINAYAAELARVTVWIGEIQWMLNHGYSLSRNPILKPLDNIEQRDAILNENGTEPEWPSADAIVGNPPFLGDKRMRSELGDEYVDKLRGLYDGRISGGTDLVTYWFEKARAQIDENKARVAGLVATNSIRQQRNRLVVERILASQSLFNAWDDERWINEGADVRVSLLCFGKQDVGSPKVLNGVPVDEIYSDLTSSSGGRVDVTRATSLPENSGHSFFGLSLAGAFDIPGDLARSWLSLPNPNGRPNKEVLRPICNGNDVLKEHKDRWVIDFGPTMEESEASLYEAPFEYVLANIKPKRLENRERIRREKWWRLGRPRPELRKALEGLDRYIATVETSRHRVFVWLPSSVAPEHKLVVFPHEDDVTFGILSSRFHIIWAIASGGNLGVGNDPVYSTTKCFLTFPFPEGFILGGKDFPRNSEKAWAIAHASSELIDLRENWLRPQEWVNRVPEIVPGYPDRLIPKEGREADLKKRTLTNLYSGRPTWLDNAHRQLDEAVAAAYGWPADLSDNDVLARLLELNLSRP